MSTATSLPRRSAPPAPATPRLVRRSVVTPNGSRAPAPPASFERSMSRRRERRHDRRRLRAPLTDTPYEMWDIFGPYTEVVTAGAFDNTLAASPLVEFTRNHGMGGGIPMAHTRNATLALTAIKDADETGLWYEASVDTPESTCRTWSRRCSEATWPNRRSSSASSAACGRRTGLSTTSTKSTSIGVTCPPSTSAPTLHLHRRAQPRPNSPGVLSHAAQPVAPVAITTEDTAVGSSSPTPTPGVVPPGAFATRALARHGLPRRAPARTATTTNPSASQGGHHEAQGN